MIQPELSTEKNGQEAIFSVFRSGRGIFACEGREHTALKGIPARGMGGICLLAARRSGGAACFYPATERLDSPTLGEAFFRPVRSARQGMFLLCVFQGRGLAAALLLPGGRRALFGTEQAGERKRSGRRESRAGAPRVCGVFPHQFLPDSSSCCFFSSSSRRARRSTLPTRDLGSSSRNSNMRGTL